ncbi:family 78 glycoside hydrolase catalytic domain [Echinicola vietnamensis]|uniref:Glycogen debranching enzyme n=1 Tax=Echinicola vietnamensis (strain DSM 17526 / LMG 23754 / KMM 6221) TaxID=926556 RepID=L0FYW4_ECHVK|nr:family 78 glycoside hydrolase catalytic domain [Echinicola vietnamensis]AGA77946.1 glycogen debranching enzyme [Echinicola vietnamensis DSM 17526]
METQKYIPLLLLFILLVAPKETWAQENENEPSATWIWYPGDYEIWLSNKMQARRTERGAFLPPLWRYYSPYALVTFRKEFTLPAEDEIAIYTEGQFKLQIDGKQQHGSSRKITIPPGDHSIVVKVYNQERVPAVFIEGDYLVTDDSWKVTFEDKEWIDESGKASDQSGTNWEAVGTWDFNTPEDLPSEFSLATTPQFAAAVQPAGEGQLIDFGKETFGYIQFHGLKGEGNVNIYYGESEEEALDSAYCETLDYLSFDGSQAEDYTVQNSKAFRYVQVQHDPGVSYDSVSMLYEYLPVEYRGEWNSSDELLNEIWDVSAYTMHLNTREFFLDGIKRDRWIWSGDAYQSYLMNYYLFFDNASVRRTLLALRGKEPVSSHMNTIMDYSFYWFVGIYDYYLYSGDEEFIKNFYPRMVSMMDFCLGRRNEHGMMEGLPGDWIFIDWADGLSKQGEVSFEQMLLARSLEAMAVSAEIAGDHEGHATYQKLADEMKEKLFEVFWSEDREAIMHQRVDGKVLDNVTRYANMFGIFFDYFSDDQKEAVKHSVLLNDEVQKITTPYMRFYELEALCAMGEQAFVLDEIRDYWGGMLDLGATSFWEKYDPNESGTEHLSMYGRPYGKSLCHAWGASPVYLFGKYYLGVKPLSAGYETYEIRPELGGLDWMEGKVPTPNGDVSVYCSTKEIKVSSDEGEGVLIFKSKSKPRTDQGEIKALGGDEYELALGAGKEYVVKYKALK